MPFITRMRGKFCVFKDGTDSTEIENAFWRRFHSRPQSPRGEQNPAKDEKFILYLKFVYKSDKNLLI